MYFSANWIFQSRQDIYSCIRLYSICKYSMTLLYNMMIAKKKMRVAVVMLAKKWKWLRVRMSEASRYVCNFTILVGWSHDWLKYVVSRALESVDVC